MRIATIAALILVVAGTAAASEMQRVRITMTPADWDAAAAALPDKSTGSPKALFVRLNATLADRYGGIARSSVPVLLPLDPAMWSKEAPDAALAGFRASKFFLAGPAGYDATFFIDAGMVPGVVGRYVKPVEVEVSGAAFVYELDAPGIAEQAGEPKGAKGLEDFPGIRRILREAHVRYVFERFGVPYAVSIECFDQRPRPKRFACRDADQIAVRFLRALHVVGGTPGIEPAAPRIDISRPQAQSPTFTYYPSGDLITNSGYKKFGGRADDHVYARIRFPLAQAPAFAKSQSFNPWGDCYRTGHRGRIGRKGVVYSCKRNGEPLVFDESSPQNFSYPWRDNFCETRDRQVGQCPGGYGHQGQDIRPSSCVLRNAEADRCEPYQHDVSAAHDGMIWRNAGQYAAYLVVNAADARIRVRYMHMNPKRMDADGLLSGRVVRQGDVLGQVGTFDDNERGTSYHLHFDMQVMTRDGWVWVNPYTTLIAAYEHLIGARGVELPNEEPTAVAAPAPKPAATEPAKAAPAPAAAQRLAEPAKPTPAAGRKVVRRQARARRVAERGVAEHTIAERRVTTDLRAARKKPLRHAIKKGRRHLSQDDTAEPAVEHAMH